MTITINNLYDGLNKSIENLRKDAPLVKQSRSTIENILSDGKAYYGINTGFGALVSKRIETKDLQSLQEKIVLSHAVGFGDFIPKDISRLMLQLKIHQFGHGHSGVSLEVFNRLLLFAEHNLIPVIPKKGSLGASGDLAPLAHLSLPLIGEGYFWNEDGSDHIPAKQGLQQHDLEPIALQPKDGLALCNGTQMMLAYGASILHRALTLVKQADIIGTMTLEALLGSAEPFDERIHKARPHAGQIAVAKNVRSLLKGSETLPSHKDCGRVQDPYSLRCMPQVHGATRDALAHVRSIFEIEIGSTTDNPLVLRDGSVVSGGNFHGQPLALALDYAALAIAELASISERRIYLLTKGDDVIPEMVVNDPGVNSGVMVAHYATAALVSENKVLCHPASVDSIPTCLGQEDHVSMGSISATKLYDIYSNVEKVLATELFVAAQALEYRKPLSPGKGVKAAYDHVRKSVHFMEKDGLYYEEINKCAAVLSSGSVVSAVEDEIGELSPE